MREIWQQRESSNKKVSKSIVVHSLETAADFRGILERKELTKRLRKEQAMFQLLE